VTRIEPWYYSARVTSPVRKILTLAVLLAGIFLGGKFLGLFVTGGAGPVPVEIRYVLGDPPVAAGLEVVFHRGEDVVARFETKLVGPVVTQKTRLPAGEEHLDITLIGANGARRTVQRTITAERDAVIRLELAHEAVE
jgi:hypothetical protein